MDLCVVAIDKLQGFLTSSEGGSLGDTLDSLERMVIANPDQTFVSSSSRSSDDHKSAAALAEWAFLTLFTESARNNLGSDALDLFLTSKLNMSDATQRQGITDCYARLKPVLRSQLLRLTPSLKSIVDIRCRTDYK